MFDPITYFQNLNDTCNLTKQKYLFSRISGMEQLEEILQNRKRNTHFLAVEDSENGTTNQAAARGFWERRPYTVFLCSAAKYGDMDQRQQLLAELRQVFRTFLTKIIKDKVDNPLTFFDTRRIPFFEIPGFIANGCVGIYFIISVDNQIDLSYDPGQWT